MGPQFFFSTVFSLVLLFMTIGYSVKTIAETGSLIETQFKQEFVVRRCGALAAVRGNLQSAYEGLKSDTPGSKSKLKQRFTVVSDRLHLLEQSNVCSEKSSLIDYSLKEQHNHSKARPNVVPIFFKI